MRPLWAVVVCWPVWAWAQTLQPSPDGAPYGSYVNTALNCLAGEHWSEETEKACLTNAMDECRAKAGVFEACLEALEKAYVKGFDRVDQRMQTLGNDAWGQIFRVQHNPDRCSTPVCRAEVAGEGLRNLLVMARGREVLAGAEYFTREQWLKLMQGGDD